MCFWWVWYRLMVGLSGVWVRCVGQASLWVGWMLGGLCMAFDRCVVGEG